MKRLVEAVLAAAMLLAFAQAASAEWGMYVSRNGSGWVLERTFAFKDTVENSCERTARETWMTQGPGKGNVTGVGCAEYTATSFTQRQAPRAPAQAPAQAQQEQGGRGRKDAAIEYRQRVLDSAMESARTNSGGHQRVYTNGDSYYGREVQDAQKALDAERGRGR